MSNDTDKLNTEGEVGNTLNDKETTGDANIGKEDTVKKDKEVAEVVNTNTTEDTREARLLAMEKKYKIMRIVVMLLVASFIVLSIGYISYNKHIDSQNITGNSIIASTASNKEKKEYTEKIAKAMEDIRAQNSFIAVQDGIDTGVVIVYNKNGEAFAQSSDSSYITIYRDDHKAVRYTEYVDFGYDSDVLSILENVSKMTQNNKTTILKDHLPNKDGFTSYIVDVRTWDGVLEMYSMFDKEFGDLMVGQLKQSLQSDETNTETEQINFRFIYILDTEGKLAAAECYVYFGDKASDKVTMEELGLSWKFDGIQDISDWELEKDWYSEDWETLSEWADISMAEELLTKQYETIANIVKEYFPEITEDTDTTDNSSTNNNNNLSTEDTSSTDNTSSVNSDTTTDTTPSTDENTPDTEPTAGNTVTNND